MASSTAWICTAIMLVAVGMANSNMNNDKALLKKLLEPSVYNRRVIPKGNDTHKIIVKLGVIIEQISELNDRRQELHWAGFVRVVWNNPYLRWNPEEWGGQEHLFLREEDLWVPDIVILERLDANIEFQEQPRRLLYVNYNGDIKWVLGGDVIVTSCPLNIYKFPFDKQTCTMQVGSYGIPAEDLETMDPKQSMYNPIRSEDDNAQWEVVGSESELITKVYENDLGRMAFSYLVFKVHLQRKSLYYVLNVLLPLLLMSMLMLGTFFIPPDGGEKMSFGITLLLAYNVIQLVITDNMPQTSDNVPIITAYVTGLLIMGALLIPLSTATIYVHNHGYSWLPRFVHPHLDPKLRTDTTEMVDMSHVKPHGAQNHQNHVDAEPKRAPLARDETDEALSKSCLTDGDKLSHLLVTRMLEHESQRRNFENEQKLDSDKREAFRQAARRLDMIFLKIVGFFLVTITFISAVLIVV